MSTRSRPRVVVSQCLGFAAVRYDGQALRSRFVEALRDHVEFVQVCPEVGIGLGVPRDPIRIEVTAGGAAGSRDPEGRVPVAEAEAAAGELRLVQPSTGRDLTDKMHAFAERFLEEVRPVDGFILKSRSPSCGIADTKRFEAGADDPLEDRGPGLFARAVLERFPHAAVEDEARLANHWHRHRFLTRLWAAARLRDAGSEGAALSRTAEQHALPYPRALMDPAGRDGGRG